MSSRRQFLQTGAAAAGLGAPAADRRPNLVLIFLDDLGYGDFSCYGHPTILTPNTDRMAGEGVRFTQFYASPLCAPSRGQLMTGRLCARTGITTNFFPDSQGGIPDSEITVADVLKKAGYATMCVGKWHLGSLPRYLPVHHGFDDYFGIPYSNDMSKATNSWYPWPPGTPPTPLIRGEKTIEQEPDQSLLTRRYTEAANDFIRRSSRAGKPFFLYLPHSMPHQPVAASPAFQGKSLCGRYGDAVQELDWSLGEILRTLAEEKLDTNTLVILASDNGAANAGSSGPFRDGKGTVWEGGVRVPCIARWPGRIPAGVVTPAFATTMDMFPTFAALAGAEMPSDRVYDGEDIGPVLFRNHPGREPLFFYYRNSPGGTYDREEKLDAVRKGRWKLHANAPAPALYDVQQDIAEKRNVAARNPEVVKDLLALMERHRSSFQPAPTQR